MKNIVILGTASQLTLGSGGDWLEAWRPQPCQD
jgi:hypothetical protein